MSFHRSIIILLPIAMLFIAIESCTKRAAPAVSRNVSLTNMNVDIINDVNVYRKSKGLPALHLLSIANIEAERHSQNMALKRVPFGHDGFKARAIAIANDLKGTSATGENVASGKMTAQEVLQLWLKSPAHRANIEGNFNYTGVGTAKDNRGTIYYTQIFVKK